MTLTGNTCRANNYSGILFRNAAGGEVEGNICQENLWSGIAVRGEDTRPTLTANQCNNNGAWGIISWAGANRDVSADDETLDNWKGGMKHRPSSRENTNAGAMVTAASGYCPSDTRFVCSARLKSTTISLPPAVIRCRP